MPTDKSKICAKKRQRKCLGKKLNNEIILIKKQALNGHSLYFFIFIHS